MTRARRTTTRLALLLLCAGALACGDRASETSTTIDAAGCAALLQLALPQTQITAADWVDASSGLAGPLPAHCRVRGTIDPRVGRDGVAYGFGFELRLPALWTHRFYFQGGSGSDGVVIPALGSIVGGDALAAGAAVVSTDSGHQGTGPEFGLDPQARIDYGYRTIDRVTGQARAILVQAYGREPEHSYFCGCSQGGRQGFVASQRFPEYFDGIVAGSPGFDLPKASVGEAWNTQAVAAIAKTFDAVGEPRLADTFSDADLTLLVRGVLRECDGLDGLVDGIVDDLVDCRFDPATLQCSGEKDASCLSAPQVDALHKIFGGAHNSRGEALYSDFPYDGGLADPSPIGSLRAWSLGNPSSPTNDASNITLGAGLLAYIFVTPPVATKDLLGYALGFDFDRDAPKIFATTDEYTESSVDFMSATSTDLSRFRRHGGKLIVYQGGSDGVFSVNDTIRWYRGLDQANGGRAADFARLFIVPGMGHCVGGPATDQFDGFGAIVDWVEQGRAPDQIVATAGPKSPFPGRTRPLCPFPKQTRYGGQGSTESADSFGCR